MPVTRKKINSETKPGQIHKADVLNTNIQDVLGHDKGQQHISIT